MHLLLWAAFDAAAALVHTTLLPKTRLLATTTLVDSALDTLEDATLHLTRLSEGDARTSALVMTTTARRSSCSAGRAARAHQGRRPNKYRVVVVSPRNHFVFTPMLASAAVGRGVQVDDGVRPRGESTAFVEGRRPPWTSGRAS